MRTIPFVYFLIFSLSLFSQSRQVTIHVKDKNLKEALAFCHICIENKTLAEKKYFVTDHQGKANFVFKGPTIISISYLGYKTIIDTLKAYSPKITYKLETELFTSEEVVVTGQNKPVSVDNSIYNIKLISKDKIELQTSNNLAELLDNELNVSINNDPSTGSSVNIQGISGENIKILIDGVPVIGRMDGNIDLSQINLDEIDHIELVEGPMSVIYGSNALAGVINIITKENKYAKLKTGIDTYYESVGTYNLTSKLYLKNKHHALGLNVGRNFFSGFTSNNNKRTQEWKPKEQYKGSLYYTYEKQRLKIKYKIDAFRELLINQGDIYTKKTDTLINDTAGYWYEHKANDSWFYTTRINHSLQSDYDFSEFSNLNVLLAYSYYNRRKDKYNKDLSSLEKTLSTSLSDLDTTTFNAYTARSVFNHNNPGKKISYQMGFDLVFENALGKRLKDNYQDIGDYAGFASLQWKAFDNFILQPALRASYNTKYKAPLTPSINFKYQLGKTNYRLSYSRGFRAPSLKELYLHFFDSNHQIEGNDELKSEHSHNYNLAISHKNKILNKPIDFKLTGFYNRIFDMISLVQVSLDNDLHYTNANIGEFESLGATFNVNFRPLSRLNINAGFSQIGTKGRYDVDAFSYSTNANTNVSLRFLKNTATLAVFYKYIGRMPRYYYDINGELAQGYINEYHNMDITVSKTFFKNKLSISAGIKNLFDNTNITGVGSGGSGAHSGGSSSTLVGWGRSYFMGLKFNFSKY